VAYDRLFKHLLFIFHIVAVQITVLSTDLSQCHTYLHVVELWLLTSHLLARMQLLGIKNAYIGGRSTVLITNLHLFIQWIKTCNQVPHPVISELFNRKQLHWHGYTLCYAVILYTLLWQ